MWWATEGNDDHREEAYINRLGLLGQASRLRPYLALFLTRIQELLQYRAAALAGLGTQIFWGLVRVMIFEAFYLSTTNKVALSFPQIVTYVWLGQCFFRLLPSGPAKDVAQLIREGGVAYELVRPLDLYWLWFCRSLAALCGPTLIRSVPMFWLAFFFFGMSGPASLLHGLSWSVALCLGVLVSAGIVTLVSLSLFWTVSGEGITRLIPTLAWIASGSILPLVFFPDWLRSILERLPFSACLDTPARIYVGQYSLQEVPLLLGQQLFWAVVLIVWGRWVLARGLRRVVVQGG